MGSCCYGARSGKSKDDPHKVNQIGADYPTTQKTHSKKSSKADPMMNLLVGESEISLQGQEIEEEKSVKYGQDFNEEREELLKMIEDREEIIRIQLIMSNNAEKTFQEHRKCLIDDQIKCDNEREDEIIALKIDLKLLQESMSEFKKKNIALEVYENVYNQFKETDDKLIACQSHLAYQMDLYSNIYYQYDLATKEYQNEYQKYISEIENLKKLIKDLEEKNLGNEETLSLEHNHIASLITN